VRVLLILLGIFYSSFLYAETPSYKFTLGSNLGNIPLEFNKKSKNIRTLGGIKMNSWVLSPNFSSVLGKKKLLKSSQFSENKVSTEKKSLYIKFKFTF
jgi:hypothetical protein